MKGGIKGYRAIKHADCRVLCGKLTLTADCDADALLLAAIAYGIFPTSLRHKSRVEAIFDLWQLAMKEYCKDTGATIKEGKIVVAKKKATPKVKPARS